MFSINAVCMRNVDSSANCPLYKFTTTIEDVDVVMEIDTGSAVTLLSSSDFKRLRGSTNTLNPATIILKSYTEDTIKYLGEKETRMNVGDQVHDLTIRVVEGPSLLGRDMMNKFTLSWHNIFSVVSTTSDDIIQQYPGLFENSTVGKLKGVQVSLKVSYDNPVFVKPRVVPFAVRSQHKTTLEKLEADDIIEKIKYSDWASSTVPCFEAGRRPKAIR